MRKNNARINEKKNAQEAKNYTQAMRYIRCLYTKKNYLSLELNKAVLEAL